MKRMTVAVLAALLMLALSLPGVTPVAYAQVTLLTMEHYDNISLGYKWCGPCSGVSIGRYYDKMSSYSYLPGAGTNYDAMYLSLYAYMDTVTIPGFGDYTDPLNYGPGFVEMALHYNYDNFGYDYVHSYADSTWSNITNAINSGHPVALLTTCAWGFRDVPALAGSDAKRHASAWPCTQPHAIAIRGYYTNYWDGQTTHSRVIRCTDSFAGHNDLLLDYDTVRTKLTTTYHLIVVKDHDDFPDSSLYTEEFEWGADGDSLDDWQAKHGEVDWDAAFSDYGTSVAEIDDQYHYSGEKSLLIYRDGSYDVRTQYKLKNPSLIGFYLRRTSAATLSIANGNGNKKIQVRITSSGRLEYYKPYGWNLIGILDPNKWYRIQFMNIKWTTDPYTYDIYLTYPEGPTTLTTGTLYSSITSPGFLQIDSIDSSGSVWIDNIKDSLR